VRYNVLTSLSRQGDTLSLLLFNFSSEHAIREVQEDLEALEMDRTHQLLVYADVKSEILNSNDYGDYCLLECDTVYSGKYLPDYIVSYFRRQ
jgi:hypothetical protein